MDPREQTLCLTQLGGYKACFGNDCNTRDHIQKCYTTNGEVDMRLPTQQSLNDSTSMKICKLYNDACFSLVNNQRMVVKDCLSEYSEEKNLPVNILSDLYKSDYYTCSTPLCNDKDIVPTFCIQCDSEKDPDCHGSFTEEWLQNAKQQCPIQVHSSGCYHFFNGTHTQRGCMADLNEDTLSLCESDSDTCKKCSGDECNQKQSFQKCIYYDDSNNKEAQAESKICKRYLDECYIRILDESVHRGCTSDLLENKTDKSIRFLSKSEEKGTYKRCSDIDNCNDDPIPDEFCITCDDRDDCNENPNFDMRQKCPKSIVKNGCYMMNNTIKPLIPSKFLHVSRGCVSTLRLRERKHCHSGSDTCKTCLGDSCNIKKTFQTCHVCDTEVDGENCKTSPGLIKEKLCANYLDECYTHVENDVVRRNCIGDDLVPTVASCEENPDNCRHCSDDGPCNNEEIIPQTCVSCDDKRAGEKCQTNSDVDKFETCALSLQPKGCYHFIDQTSGDHKKGKIIHFPVEIIYFCE